MQLFCIKPVIGKDPVTSFDNSVPIAEELRSLGMTPVLLNSPGLIRSDEGSDMRSERLLQAGSDTQEKVPFVTVFASISGRVEQSDGDDQPIPEEHVVDPEDLSAKDLEVPAEDHLIEQQSWPEDVRRDVEVTLRENPVGAIPAEDRATDLGDDVEGLLVTSDRVGRGLNGPNEDPLNVARYQGLSDDQNPLAAAKEPKVQSKQAEGDDLSEAVRREPVKARQEPLQSAAKLVEPTSLTQQTSPPRMVVDRVSLEVVSGPKSVGSIQAGERFHAIDLAKLSVVTRNSDGAVGAGANDAQFERPESRQTTKNLNEFELPKGGAGDRVIRPAPNLPQTAEVIQDPGSEPKQIGVTPGSGSDEVIRFAAGPSRHPVADIDVPQDKTSRPSPFVLHGATPAESSTTPQTPSEKDVRYQPRLTEQDGAKPALGNGDGAEYVPTEPKTIRTDMRVGLPANPVNAARLLYDSKAQFLSEELGGDGLRNVIAPFQVTSSDVAGPIRPTLMAAPDLPRQIAQQITLGLRSTAANTVEITLNPAELGSVRISLSQSETGWLVSVQADRQDTLDLLRRHIGVLGQDLRDIGYGEPAFSFANGGQNVRDFGGGTSDGSAGNRGEMVVVPVDDVPGAHRAPVTSGRIDIRM